MGSGERLWDRVQRFLGRTAISSDGRWFQWRGRRRIHPWLHLGGKLKLRRSDKVIFPHAPGAPGGFQGRHRNRLRVLRAARWGGFGSAVLGKATAAVLAVVGAFASAAVVGAGEIARYRFGPRKQRIRDKVPQMTETKDMDRGEKGGDELPWTHRGRMYRCYAARSRKIAFQGACSILLWMVKLTARCLIALVAVSPVRADIVSGRTERQAAEEAGAVQAIVGRMERGGASVAEADKAVRSMTAAEVSYYGFDRARLQTAAGCPCVYYVALGLVGVVLLYHWLSGRL